MSSYYIGIEELASNALIESLRKKPENRFISYGEIESYGRRVMNGLTSKGVCVEMYLSKESTRIFLQKNIDFFEERTQESQDGLYLKCGKDVSSLVKNFRGYLAFELLQAFIETPVYD